MNSRPRPDSDSSPRRMTRGHEAAGVVHLEHERRPLGGRRDADRVLRRRRPVLDRVRDRLAHRELHVVAGVGVEAEVGGGSFREVARLLQEAEIRPDRVLAALEVRHVPGVIGK